MSVKCILQGQAKGTGGGEVASFNGRTGAVIPMSGDYSVSQITGAAPISSPVFTGSISMGRASESTIGAISTAEGYNVTASGSYSHAEGQSTIASGNRSHAEGNNTVARGTGSHAEGIDSIANGNYSHAEGEGSIAYGSNSHAEGYNTFCDSIYGGHAEGMGTISAPTKCYIPLASYSGNVLTIKDDGSINYLDQALQKITAGMEIYIWNKYYINRKHSKYIIEKVDIDAKTITLTTALPSSNFGVQDAVIPAIKDTNAYYSGHTEGTHTIVTNIRSHAEGNNTIASGDASHVEGNSSIARGTNSHAEGNYTIASGNASHAEGDSTIASGAYSHTEGVYTVASGNFSHAEGSHTVASATASHAAGGGTIASAHSQTAIGVYNISSSVESDRFIIGKGIGDSARANCLRVTNTGVYASGNYASSGADYAEMFEWADGNPNEEDRVGCFVTLDRDKIRLANQEDDFILGIISGNPSVLGDVQDDQWVGMYLYDIYGRPIWEDVEVPAEEVEETIINQIDSGETDEDGNPIFIEETKIETRIITPAHVEHRQKLNPLYDSTQKYMPRTERPEWGCVGMLGKLVVKDDGTCWVNGWCTPEENGIATASSRQTKYRVMKRLDKNHIQVLAL